MGGWFTQLLPVRGADRLRDDLRKDQDDEGQDDRERDDATVIGDSEADVEAARDLGIESVCVSSGVRSRQYLDELEPDEVLNTIVQLPRILPHS